MNFLCITPKYVNSGQPYNFYYGLAYVSSYMKHKGYNVFCRNTNHYDTPLEQQLSELIENEQIDVICTGGMSSNFNEINAIIESAKKIKPEIITVVGGAFVTSDPKLALENMQIDFGIIGEGEETMVDLADALCHGKDIDKVKGIAYFDAKSDLIITEERSVISDLDTLPIMDYEGFEYGHYVNLFTPGYHSTFTILDEVRPIWLTTARSCPFSCTFCYHPLGKKYRQRSLDHVFREIDYLVENYDINILILFDELFSSDKERMYGFAERIKRYNINWMPTLRVTDVDDKILTVFKECGVFSIGYGIENASDKILESMQKKTTISQIEKALQLTYDAGIAIQGNIILGDPEDTEETIKESIDWWLNHPEYGINLSMIQAIPDAPIFRDALSRGLIKDKLKHMKEGFPLINLTKKISDKRYEEIRSFVYSNKADATNYRIGNVVDSKITGKNNYNDNLFSIKIECPTCHNISEYKNMKQETFKTISTFICRNCNMYLRANTQKCYSDNYTISEKITTIIISKGITLVRKNNIIRHIYYGFMKKRLSPYTNKYL